MGSHSVRSRNKIDVDGFVAIASQCSVLQFKFGHLDDGVKCPSCGLAFRVGSNLVREVEKVSSSVSADDNVRMIAFRPVGRQRTRFFDKIALLVLPVQTVIRPVDSQAVPGIED